MVPFVFIDVNKGNTNLITHLGFFIYSSLANVSESHVETFFAMPEHSIVLNPELDLRDVDVYLIWRNNLSILRSLVQYRVSKIFADLFHIFL